MKIIIFYTFLNLKNVFALNYEHIVTENENSFKFFFETAVNIVHRCFFDKSKPIIVSGNWSEIDFRYNDSFIASHALVGPSTLRKANYYTRKRNIFKLEWIEVHSKLFPSNVFLIYESKLSSFPSLFEELRKSTWWNARGIFFLGSYKNCSNARYLLKTAFDFNVINALYLCKSSDTDRYVYTLNPYNKNAPCDWEFVDVKDEGNEHSTTLFKRSYSSIPSEFLSGCDCANLKFDKTLKLTTYTMTLCVTPLPMLFPRIPGSPYKVNGMSVVALRFILAKLDGRAIVIANESRGIIDADGRAHDLLADILEGRCDMGLNIEYRRNIWRSEINIFDTSGICIVTRKQELTITEQIKQILTPEFFILFVLVTVSSTVSFTIFSKQSVVKVGLDVMRLLVGVSMIYKPQRITEKIMFVSFYAVFVWYTAYMQSQLNALIAVPSYLPKVDTLDDLLQSKHEIHIDAYFKQFFHDPRLVSRMQERGTLMSCINKLKIGENVACIEDCMVIKYGINQSELLHVSRSRINEDYLTLLTHEDWPLYHRMDAFYRRLLEAGTYQFFRREIEALNSRRNYNAAKQSQRMFALEELTYSFCFLAIAYLFAIIIFFIEKLWHYCHT